VVWGTCWDDGQAPGFWPWTQALRALLDERADLHEAVRPELAAVVPELSTDPPAVAGSDTAGRLRAFDSVGRLLARATAHAPVVVILDDPQRGDQSTVDLLRFVAHQRQPGALMLVGAYRPHEIRAGIAASIADLATAAELVALQGLSAPEVEDLVRAVAGTPAAGWARLVHDRSGGHPFFAAGTGPRAPSCVPWPPRGRPAGANPPRRRHRGRRRQADDSTAYEHRTGAIRSHVQRTRAPLTRSARESAAIGRSV
jgi:hypothetical protein